MIDQPCEGEAEPVLRVPEDIDVEQDDGYRARQLYGELAECILVLRMVCSTVLGMVRLAD